ncbi:MAG: RluA family pseudouridine synthase [Bacterioplanes sp.]|nr:RluA family pseudouridine synthase [Bacterioplanes sp.]
MSKTPLASGFDLQWTVFSACGLSDSVVENYHHGSPEQIHQAFAAGWVRVNDRLVYSEQALVPGDRVQLWLPSHIEADVDIQWHLLWKRHDLMVVHKPAGLPVSRTTRNLFNTLISLVRRATQYKEAHLLHRLDAETSGLMVLANHSHADKRYKKHLDRLMIGKVYHALVWGDPDWNELDFGCYLAERLDSPIRTQMHVVDEHEADTRHTPKWSQTQFSVLRRYGAYTLVSCRLQSGRKHQIRAQLAHLGHAIIGDKIYSQEGRYYLARLTRDLTEQDVVELGAPHHLLHAYELQLQFAGETHCWRDEEYPAAWQTYVA